MRTTTRRRDYGPFVGPTLRTSPALAAGGAAAAAMYGVEVATAGATTAELLAVLPALALVGCGAALGRHAPVIGLAAFGAGYAVQTAVTGLVDSLVVLVVWMLLLAACGRWSAPRGLAAGAVLGTVPLGVFAIADGAASGPSALALYALPLLCGRALRNRDERHRAEVALLQAEQARDRAAERVRWADDVHDLLGHALTSIVVQARAAAAALPDDPAGSRGHLASVETVGRDALTELRSVVSRLASDSRLSDATAVPGVEGLDQLLSRMPVQSSLEVDPAVATAPDEVQACVYLVVQESVTNAVRHSSAQEVHVVVRRDTDGLAVDVRDPGPAVGATEGTGRGLHSMMRRVAALGGTLDAGRDGTGFAVRARLPLQGPS